MENSYNTSKENSSGNKTLNQNSSHKFLHLKGKNLPTMNLFRTELSRKELHTYEGSNTQSNSQKNEGSVTRNNKNKLRFEKFELENSPGKSLKKNE